MGPCERSLSIWYLRSQVATNALISGAEYFVVPILYFAATPLILAEFGLPRYGVWILVNSAAGLSGVVSFGLGDATTKLVSERYGSGDVSGARLIVQASVAMLIVLGTVGAAIWWLTAEVIVQSARLDAPLIPDAVLAARLSAVLLAIRVVGCAFVGGMRGLERFDVVVGLSVATKATILIATVATAMTTHSLAASVTAMILVCSAAIIFEARLLARLVSGCCYMPAVPRRELRAIIRFGTFSSLQSVAAIFTSHVDRLMIGSVLGAGALGLYGVCSQVAQQTFAVLAATFSVLMPAISRSASASDQNGWRRHVPTLVCVNIAAAALMTIVLIAGAHTILKFWVGEAIAADGAATLRMLAFGYGLIAVNVVVHFVLLGTGHIRFVAITNVLAAVVSTAALATTLGTIGIVAGGIAKIVYGTVLVSNYACVVRLVRARALTAPSRASSESPA